MPRPQTLGPPLEISAVGGYYPSAPTLPPDQLQSTLRYGLNGWLRPYGGIEPTYDVAAVSGVSTGSRIFQADIDRWEIAGAPISGRLPYAGLLRGPGGVIFFVSELAGQQVYKNEVLVAGMTTSATPGRLRIAIPTSGGAYDTYDAGFDKANSPGVVISAATGFKNMSGPTGVAIVPWRITTGATGPPSDITYFDLQSGANPIIEITLPASVAGQDGWVYAGTRPGDPSGELHVIRYIRTPIRGTFTATNGLPNITLGIGTYFQEDLRVGDVIEIDAAAYRVIAVPAPTQTTFTVNLNFAGVTGAGKTARITNAAAEWYDAEASLTPVVDSDVIRLPECAGVFTFANQYFVWGVTDRVKNPNAKTGPGIVATLPNNPEHCKATGLMLTASGADIVNVQAGDEQVFIMTTAGLDYPVFTGDPVNPYRIRTVLTPGFKSTTAGVVYKNTFFGYTDRPVKVMSDGTVDLEFGNPVWSAMAALEGQRSNVLFDPRNMAVLYCFDNGSSLSTVLPWMVSLDVWNIPHTFTTRFLDGAVVQGRLYLTYFNGASYLTVLWEGGPVRAPYFVTQFNDRGALDVVETIKEIQVAGRMASVAVFLGAPGVTLPDVSNTANAEAIFTLAATEQINPMILTNMDANSFALGITMNANAADRFFKANVRGYNRGEPR